MSKKTVAVYMTPGEAQFLAALLANGIQQYALMSSNPYSDELMRMLYAEVKRSIEQRMTDLERRIKEALAQTEEEP
jgi:hypothetical protein